MKHLITLAAAVCVSHAALLRTHAESSQLEYFGQAPPALIPQIFGPGLLSTKSSELNCACSPDGNEVYFTTRRVGRYTLMVLKRKDGVWGERSVASFSGEWGQAQNMGSKINTRGYEWCPMLSPDGKYLFFTCDGDIRWVDAALIEGLRAE